MPNSDEVFVQVTYRMPARVLQWAIGQAQGTTHAQKRNLDHVIAILIASHKEAKVVEVHTRAA